MVEKYIYVITLIILGFSWINVCIEVRVKWLHYCLLSTVRSTGCIGSVWKLSRHPINSSETVCYICGLHVWLNQLANNLTHLCQQNPGQGLTDPTQLSERVGCFHLWSVSMVSWFYAVEFDFPNIQITPLVLCVAEGYKNTTQLLTRV